MRHYRKILILYGVALLGFATLWAQAPPGPMGPPPPSVAASSAPPPPKKPEIPARKNIMGAWRFNKDDSDDPRDKLRQSKGSNSGGNPGGYGGPRIGFPGGPMGGGPYGGGGRQAQSDDSSRLGDLVNPAHDLQVLQHNPDDPEVDMLDDREHRHIFYTDGRKIDKQKDPSTEEVSAHWDDKRLVTDEKGPRNGKLSRTFELSSDGHQLLETVHVTDKNGNNPITINYVYDAIDPSNLSFPAH
jgi:hypothetical protein